MHRWNSIATQVIALIIMIGSAHAFEDSLYPDLKGQWTRATSMGWAYSRVTTSK